MVENTRNRDTIFRWVHVCELLHGQSYRFYESQRDDGVLPSFRFDRYYLLLSGLTRKVYRSYFDIDAIAYTNHFIELEQEICRLLQERNVDFLSCMQLYDHSKRFAMIFTVPENQSTMDVAQLVSNCFNNLYARIFDMKKTPYCNYTVLSNEIQGYDCLPDAFRDIDMLSKQQFFDMRTMVMTPALLTDSSISFDREQFHEDVALLKATTRTGDTAATEQAFTSLFDQLAATRNFDLLKTTMHEIRALTEGLLASAGKERDNRHLFEVEQYPTFAHLRKAIWSELIAVMESLSCRGAVSMPVLEAMRYLRHHFMEDVAATDVARHIRMSTSWLSKHFNQECGMSVPAYLMEVRLEHAKKLLTQTNLMICEVALACGFENSRYFVSVFKKATGITPKLYREQKKRL